LETYWEEGKYKDINLVGGKKRSRGDGIGAAETFRSGDAGLGGNFGKKNNPTRFGGRGI